MPKALSLKKQPLTGTQKSITQFFKDIKKDEIKTDDKKTNQLQSQNNTKRKATSPFKSPEKEKAIKPTQSNINQNIHKNYSKRVKVQSPVKENMFKKENHERKNAESIDSQLSTKLSLSPSKRSPLSTVDNQVDDDVINDSESSPIKSIAPSKLSDNVDSPVKESRTPKKSGPDKIEVRRSPRLASIEKSTQKQENISPTKLKSVKSLNFDDDLDNSMFNDNWDEEEMAQMDIDEDLDLTIMQRCEIVQVRSIGGAYELCLKNSDGKTGTCIIEGIWSETPLLPGDIVSITAKRSTNSGRFAVTNTAGLLVLRPDHLMSTTSVVAGVFCRRRAVLQERFKGIDTANTAMTIGILIHELVQKTLTERIHDPDQLRKVCKGLLAGSTSLLYGAGISADEAAGAMETYIVPLAEFMATYVMGEQSGIPQKDKWPGRIDEVVDIEENVCCPQLGLKGKIDATLQVTIHEKKGKERMQVPLELKSGMASGSAEHRGQVLLYCMMLSVQRGDSPVSDRCHLQRALLLYLRDRVDLRQVSCGYPERRDLVMLRNQLVQYLAAGPADINVEKLSHLEDVSAVVTQRLPEPISHATACARCPYLTVCSLHLWHTPGATVSDKHPLSQLRPQALGHLTTEHIHYFLRWSALLKMEERAQMTSSPLYALWTEEPGLRVKRGVCIADLVLLSVKPSGDRYLHVFQRENHVTIKESNKAKTSKGPQEGEFSIVSVDNRPWIAAGVIQLAKGLEVHILLERDLSRRLDKSTKYCIDTYESYATTVQNLTNLAALMDDTDAADRLRKLIIDKATPEFSTKLPREVGRLGAKLMRSLNVQQQRAVLRAVAANDYCLLQGLPGTGKTQTISVLIQMLVALQQRVLVTAHTHSAVDTVLMRLPETLKVLRLGTSARVAGALQSRCEENVVATCNTTEELSLLYDSMEVVGVTCLGAAHALLSRATFDVCVVDEATQVLQCTVLRPLLAAKKFILVGDPDQLPPVVRSNAARRSGMEESLFHRLANADATTTLQLQYRMNEPLVRLANKVAYKGSLKCANDVVRNGRISIDFEKVQALFTKKWPWLVQVCSPEPEAAAIFVNVLSKMADSKRSCSNTEEACIVLAVVDALTKGGTSPSDIGIIAPYREQVALLRGAIAKLQHKPSTDVSTVDQFQGRDKSVIIYSCTRCDVLEKEVVEGEILNDQRRLAVSVTRAKHKFVLIGREDALQRYAPLKTTIDSCARVDTKYVLDSVVSQFKCYVP